MAIPLLVYAATFALSLVSFDQPPDSSSNVDLTNATPVTLWATNYYLLEVGESSGSTSVPIRNRRDETIGPRLSARDWCAAAVEGSVRVNGVVFNSDGTRDPRQADCRHNPSERLRWRRTADPYGTGSRNNPLIPFRTLACDFGSVGNSRPWLNGGYARFGDRIYIPAARGVRLPDGSVHDGIFTCGDIGGAITGNHIDVFLGAVRGGESGARQVNPFNFIHSSANRTFEAYVLPRQ